MSPNRRRSPGCRSISADGHSPAEYSGWVDVDVDREASIESTCHPSRNLTLISSWETSLAPGRPRRHLSTACTYDCLAQVQSDAVGVRDMATQH